MASRRRQKNPVLGRIIVISVLLHVLILPVLAYFGAFKKIGQSLGMAEVIVVPPPPAEKTPPALKKTPKVAAKSEPKGKSASSHAKAAPSRPALNQPNVVAARGGESGSDSGPVVNPNGTGKAGDVPTPAGGGTGNGNGNGAGGATAKPTESPNVTPEAKPTPVLPTPKPEPVKPKVPVFAEAEALEQPNPVIPDELRNEVLNASVVAEFVVRTDGTVGDVKLTHSAGIDQLDRVALETLRKWKFRPATRDGEPTEGRVRLHIDFEVR